MANEAKIKLSAEGVEQVVNAFRKVQQEAKRTGDEGAKGIGALNKSLSSLKSLVGVIGVGALVLHLKETAKAAIETADAIGDLAEITGATTETISLFAGAAKESGISMEVMTKAIVNINKSLDALRGGDRGAAELFKRIGLSLKDFAGLSADESLKKIAVRLGELGGSAGTVAVAAQLLGKKGLEAMEVFQKMADEGMDPLIKRMKEMGIIFSQDFTDAADRAKKAMADFEIRSQALTVQLLSGLMPALDGLSDSFGDASGSGDQLKQTGEIIGSVVVAVTKLVVSLAKAVVGVMVLLADYFNGVKDAFLAVAHLDFRALVQANVNTFKSMKNTVGAVFDDITNLYADKPLPPLAIGGKKGGKTTPQDARNLGDMAKAAKAREEFLKAQLENELKLFQANQALKSDDEKRDFENRKISLQAYFTDRYNALGAESKKELDVLERQRKIIAGRANFEAGDAEKKAKDLAEIDEKIALKKIENHSKLSALGQEERVATEALRKEAVDHENQMLTLQGQRFAAARAALEEEIKLRDAVLVQQGKTVEERERSKTAFRAQAGAAIDFDEQKEKAEAALRDLDRDAAEIRRSVEAGVLRQIEGEERIVALQQQRLPLLDAIAKKLGVIAERTNDTQKIEQANQFKDAVADVGVAANKVGRDLAEVRAAIESAGVSVGADFLNAIVTGSKTASAAVNDFAKSVLASFASIISKKLSEKLFSSLFGNLSDAGGGILGLLGLGGSKSGGYLSGASTPPEGHAEGGKIVGPGSGSSDSIPAIGPLGRLLRVSNNEFIVRAAVVQQPGVEAFLHQFNRGLHLPAIRSFSRAPRFAGGGMVGGTVGASSAPYAAPPVQVVISPDMANMTLKDWLEGHLARELANR